MEATQKTTTPITSWFVTLVMSTTTRTGTMRIRVSDRKLGRFMGGQSTPDPAYRLFTGRLGDHGPSASANPHPGTGRSPRPSAWRGPGWMPRPGWECPFPAGLPGWPRRLDLRAVPRPGGPGRARACRTQDGRGTPAAGVGPG